MSKTDILFKLSSLMEKGITEISIDKTVYHGFQIDAEGKKRVFTDGYLHYGEHELDDGSIMEFAYPDNRVAVTWLVACNDDHVVLHVDADLVNEDFGQHITHMNMPSFVFDEKDGWQMK